MSEQPEKPEYLPPGRYRVEVKLVTEITLDADDELTEDNLTDMAVGNQSEMVDWEVKRISSR